MTKRIAILSGGASSEAEVSRNSGQAIEKALSKKHSQVKQFELDKEIAPQLIAYEPDVIFPALHGPPSGHPAGRQHRLCIAGLFQDGEPRSG